MAALIRTIMTPHTQTFTHTPEAAAETNPVASSSRNAAWLVAALLSSHFSPPPVLPSLFFFSLPHTPAMLAGSQCTCAPFMNVVRWWRLNTAWTCCFEEQQRICFCASVWCQAEILLFSVFCCFCVCEDTAAEEGTWRRKRTGSSSGFIIQWLKFKQWNLDTFYISVYHFMTSH